MTKLCLTLLSKGKATSSQMINNDIWQPAHFVYCTNIMRMFPDLIHPITKFRATCNLLNSPFLFDHIVSRKGSTIIRQRAKKFFSCVPLIKTIFTSDRDASRKAAHMLDKGSITLELADLKEEGMHFYLKWRIVLLPKHRHLTN